MRRAAVLLGVLLLALPAGAARRATHENPHAEVTATAAVDSQPKKKHHRNGRDFEEFRARLLSVAAVDPNAPIAFPLEAGREVNVVHDLTCGGQWIELLPGDRVDLRGEYVSPPEGPGIIHFTHPAGGKCGRAGSHIDGYLRRHVEAAAVLAPAPADPNPIALSSLQLDAFRASVRPILSVKCAPCHEPGGKMYGRLPFDDPATVASHSARMATRLKGDDRKALETWAAAASPQLH
jgi:hypothetical protein